MSKPLLVFQAPIATRRGYGDHSRDILKSLFELDKYDVKIVPTRWGNTPQDQINPQTEFGQKIIQNIVTQLDRQPDIFIQVSVANEFKRVGKYNIGITAGVETTIAPQEFIQGGNQMDLIITPSQFTKDVLSKTSYDQVDKNTKQKIGELKLEKPVEVLFEGVDTTIFNGKCSKSILDNVDTDFLPEENTVYLEGELKEVHKSSANKFLLEQSKWFNVDYSKAAGKIFDVYKNYEKHLKKSIGLKTNIQKNFTLNKMSSKFGEILDKYVKVAQPVKLKLPEIKKL